LAENAEQIPEVDNRSWGELPVEEREAIMEQCLDNLAFFSEGCLKIVPKAGGLVPFVLNIFQEKLHAAIEKQLARQGYVRVLILKPRQLGCSTYIGARFYFKATWGMGENVLVVAHEDKATRNIFKMIKRFHKHNLPHFKPETMASNAIELVFDNEAGTGLGSTITIQTAAGKGGRGVTTRKIHFSEGAYYGEKAMATIGGAQESMPSEYPGILGTEEIWETTANGVGEPFHKKWKGVRADEAADLPNDYICFFFAWFKYIQYSRPVTGFEIKLIQKSLTNEEKWLLKQESSGGVPVTFGQLAWRRWKIKNNEPPPGMTKEDFFKQEYPATEDEAFIFSGTGVFNSQYIKAAREEVFEPIVIGEINFATGKFQESRAGNLKIWEKPRRDCKYVLGADVAEGLGDGDYSCCDVLRVPDGKQVAQWHGHIAPDLFGRILYYLALFYGIRVKPLIGPEVNNHGHLVVHILQQLKYPFIYQRDSVDGATGKKEKKYGFLSSKSTKPQIMDILGAHLREGRSGIFCKETLDELGTYVILPNGKYSAAPGCFDDRVVSMAIAKFMLLQDPAAMRLQLSHDKKAGYREVVNA